MAEGAQRVIVLDAIAKRLEKFFGPGGSVSANALRSVVRAAWKPGSTTRPMATVVDMGSEKTGARNSDTEKNEKLKWQIVLDLNGDFSKTAEFEKWQRLVAAMKLSLQNYCPPAGVLRADVTNDDPFQVLVNESEVLEQWMIEGETEYVVQYSDLTDADDTFAARARQALETKD